MISRDMDHDKGDWLYEVKRDKALDKSWEAENGMNPPPPYETCMAMRKGASHPLDPSPCMACPSCRRNQYRRALEMDLIRHREALLDMRSAMREPAERDHPMVRYFYHQLCHALRFIDDQRDLRVTYPPTHCPNGGHL